MGLDSHKEKFTYDFGWLIQNDQISDADLCQVLLDDYSAKLYRLACTLHSSPTECIAIVDKTLMGILTNRHKYQNAIPGRAWLYTRLIRACVKSRRADYARHLQNAFQPERIPYTHSTGLLQSLDPPHALVAFFHYALSLTPEEISVTAQIPLPLVETFLADIQNTLRKHHQTCPICVPQFPALVDLEERLREELSSTSIPPALAVKNAALLKHATTQKDKHGLRARFFQSAQAGIVVLAVLAIGWIATRPAQRLAAPAPQRTLIPAGPMDFHRSGGLLSGTPAPKPTPDDLHPDVETVVDLARGNLNEWHTLFLDFEVTRFDPTGYDGMPQSVTRTQAWIDQPSRSRVIYGPEVSGPIETYAIIDQTVTGQNFRTGETFQMPTHDLITNPDLQKLLIPDQMFPTKGYYILTGRAIISGKPTWMVDWYSGSTQKIRYWIDAQYGILMRRQEFGGKGYKIRISDTIVNSVSFDASFPDSLFQLDRYLGNYFANDFTGIPDVPGNQISLAASTNPVKNDSSQVQSETPDTISLAHSHLSYQNQPMNLGDPNQRVLYPDHSLLNLLPMEGRVLLSCQRSPDGSKIAFNSVVSDSALDTVLYEASLSELQSVHPVLPDGITQGDYAFAPDNRRLAFYGCNKASGFCGIFILDTVTNRLTPLIPLTYADYLFWSPDGKQLAFVGREDQSATLAKRSTENMLVNEIIALSQSWHFTVVDSGKGDVLFESVFNWMNLNAPDNSPTRAWGTAFKPPSSGLSSCTNQPS